MTQTALAPQLSAGILSRRGLLPDKPAPTQLLGQYVFLKPLVLARDVEALFEVSNGSAISFAKKSVTAYDADALIWRYMFDGPFANITDFRASLQAQVSAPSALCLCVFDVASGRQVGVANFMNNYPTHLKIELGGIWYSPIVQRTQANTEATYLMLTHAFNLGYRRVEWKCHVDNERSRKAALAIGFTFEGIQENHMIVKERSRNTAWFRIIDTEWPQVRQRLELLLSAKML